LRALFAQADTAQKPPGLALAAKWRLW